MSVRAYLLILVPVVAFRLRCLVRVKVSAAKKLARKAADALGVKLNRLVRRSTLLQDNLVVQLPSPLQTLLDKCHLPSYDFSP
jgi:hypothetical protein